MIRKFYLPSSSRLIKRKCLNTSYLIWFNTILFKHCSLSSTWVFSFVFVWSFNSIHYEKKKSNTNWINSTRESI